MAARGLGLLGLRQPAGSGRARREEGWTGLSSGASTPSTRRLGTSLSTDGGELPVSPSCEGELLQLALAVPCLLREARCVGPDSVIHDESVSRPVRLRWHPSERVWPFHASAACRPRGCARCHACPHGEATPARHHLDDLLAQEGVLAAVASNRATRQRQPTLKPLPFWFEMTSLEPKILRLLLGWPQVVSKQSPTSAQAPHGGAPMRKWAPEAARPSPAWLVSTPLHGNHAATTIPPVVAYDCASALHLRVDWNFRLTPSRRALFEGRRCSVAIQAFSKLNLHRTCIPLQLKVTLLVLLSLHPPGCTVSRVARFDDDVQGSSFATTSSPGDP